MKNGKYVYKNKECEEKMHAFYDKAMASLGVNYTEAYVDTSFGKTHVLTIGDEKKPKILTLHGGNGISPLNIRLFLPLVQDFCIIAPDVIGMPGKSAPYRNLNTSKDDYGVWLYEITERLGIKRASFAVSSYSSAMMLSLAVIHPEKIGKSVLLVPSGIAHGKIMPMINKMMFPFIKYYFKPTKAGLDGIIETMAGQSDDLWREFFDLMMSSYKMEMRAPKEYGKKELASFNSPIMIFASNNDIFFPADKVFKKAREIFSGEISTRLIESKHLPDEKSMEYICGEAAEFLKA